MVSQIFTGTAQAGSGTRNRFFEPKPNPRLLGFLKSCIPFLFSWVLHGLRVHIDDASLARLKTMKTQRCLLLPNHPTLWDPWVMGDISHRLREDFLYVAAREIFDSFWGFQGKLFQRLGTYSIIRGASDTPSFQMTRTILTENRSRLVIFVEGETSNRNDSLLPLEPGITHLAFLAQQELYKRMDQDMEKTPSIYLIPVAIKYFHNPHGLEAHIHKALTRLEKATGLYPASGSFYNRMVMLGNMVLAETAQQWGISPVTEGSLETRIQSVEDAMLTKMEVLLNLNGPENLGYLERVRRIRNATDKWVKFPPVEESAYHHRIRTHQSNILKNLYWDLDRIVNVSSIYDGYIKPDMPMEHYVEVLRRLEREILGYYRFRHPRTAVVTIPEPIHLKEYLPAYLDDKKATMEAVVKRIEQALYQGITQSKPPADYR